jgi:hypothetical protein
MRELFRVNLSSGRGEGVAMGNGPYAFVIPHANPLRINVGYKYMNFSNSSRNIFPARSSHL